MVREYHIYMFEWDLVSRTKCLRVSAGGRIFEWLSSECYFGV